MIVPAMHQFRYALRPFQYSAWTECSPETAKTLKTLHGFEVRELYTVQAAELKHLRIEQRSELLELVQRLRFAGINGLNHVINSGSFIEQAERMRNSIAKIDEASVAAEEFVVKL